MQRNLHRIFGIERLKSRSVGGMINRIEPDFFRDRRIDHGSVASAVNGSEAWRQRSHTLVAIHLQVENFHRQRIARFSAFNIKRTSERIVSLGHAERVTRFLDGIAKAIRSVGFQDVAGLETRHRSIRSRISVFPVARLGRIAHNFALFSLVLGTGQGRKKKHSE